MLFRFLSRFGSRLRARECAGRRVRSSHLPPVRHAAVQEERTRWPACPSECPLCDKRCILARPRCKHGEAFIRFMRTYAGDPQTRTL